MIVDIVVDTNVFMHADNPREERQGSAQNFLMVLQNSETYLCVDDGFSTVDAENRSHRGSEYLANLRYGMLGYAIVAFLAASARVKMVSRSVPRDAGRTIQRHVRSARDGLFVKVAFNSSEKILASHDFADIPQGGRQQLRGIGVFVLTAEEALRHL